MTNKDFGPANKASLNGPKRETRDKTTWEPGSSGPLHSSHSSQMRSEVRKKGEIFGLNTGVQ